MAEDDRLHHSLRVEEGPALPPTLWWEIYTFMSEHETEAASKAWTYEGVSYVIETGPEVTITRIP